jgi:hypothetical protein
MTLVLAALFTALADLSSTGTSLSLTPEEQAERKAKRTVTEKVRININTPGNKKF